MKMDMIGNKVVIEMSANDMAHISDILDMAIEGFDRLDREISAGGEMTLAIANKLRRDWFDMLKDSNWHK